MSALVKSWQSASPSKQHEPTFPAPRNCRGPHCTLCSIRALAADGSLRVLVGPGVTMGQRGRAHSRGLTHVGLAALHFYHVNKSWALEPHALETSFPNLHPSTSQDTKPDQASDTR